MQSNPTFSMRRYLGNKWRLQGFLWDSLVDYGIEVDGVHTVADLFFGTGIVMHMFCQRFPNLKVAICNDCEPYTQTIMRGRLCHNDRDLDSGKLSKRLDKYSREAKDMVDNDKSYNGGYITHHMSKVDPIRKSRMFTCRNAKILDALFEHIIPKTDHVAKLSAMEAMLRTSNGMGNFQSAMHNNRVRKTDIPLQLPVPRGISGNIRTVFHCQLAEKLIRNLPNNIDVLYIDPPYNTKAKYYAFYEAFNRVLGGEKQKNIDDDKHSFLHKSTVEDTMCSMLCELKPKCKYVAISYPMEGGNMSIPKLVDILTSECKYSNVKVYTAAIPKYRQEMNLIREALVLASTR